MEPNNAKKPAAESGEPVKKSELETRVDLTKASLARSLPFYENLAAETKPNFREGALELIKELKSDWRIIEKLVPKLALPPYFHHIDERLAAALALLPRADEPSAAKKCFWLIAGMDATNHEIHMFHVANWVAVGDALKATPKPARVQIEGSSEFQNAAERISRKVDDFLFFQAHLVGYRMQDLKNISEAIKKGE